jgi:hypothetical protein
LDDRGQGGRKNLIFEKGETKMKSLAQCSLVLLLCLGFVLGQWGCAHTPPKTPSPAPEKIKPDLGTVGVAPAHFQPEFSSRKPKTKGTSAAIGAGGGVVAGSAAVAGAVAFVVAAEPWTIILLAYPPVLGAVGCAVGAGGAIGGIIGGITGAAYGESSKSVKESETALLHTLNDLNVQELMENHFLIVAREKTNRDLIVFEKQGPAALDQEVSYAHLSGKGFDTILEITVRKYGLWAEKDVSPLLTFFMTVSTRIIQTTDDTVLYTRTFLYEGGSLKYVDWGINDAQPLREELDRAFPSLATQIVEDLFPVLEAKSPS